MKGKVDRNGTWTKNVKPEEIPPCLLTDNTKILNDSIYCKMWGFIKCIYKYLVGEWLMPFTWYFTVLIDCFMI